MYLINVAYVLLSIIINKRFISYLSDLNTLSACILFITLYTDGIIHTWINILDINDV